MTKGPTGKWLYISGALLFFIAIVIGLVLKYDKPEDTAISPRINYPFRNDGNLSFITANHADTLAKIEIEIAKSDDEITRGLMERDSLASNRGMLFVFSSEDQRTFWMKNTRFSLDILFIGSDKKIKYIAVHTIPYSTNPIPGFFPSQYVLEVNAGFCKTHHIRPGVLIDF